jgi:ribokinase
VDPDYLDSVRGSLGGGGNPGRGNAGRGNAGGGNPGGDGGSPGGGGNPGGGRNSGGGNPGGGFFLFQLELPIKAVQRGLEICRESGGTSILDPAPAQELSASVLELVDIITPNQGEAKLLTGVEVSDEKTARQAADKLVSEGVGKVVIKAGADGAYVLSEGEFTHVPGFSVDVKDTTAAGDSFNAGLAFALGRGDNVVDAARFACAVGALSTTAVGAQSGMPKLKAVQELLDEQG